MRMQNVLGLILGGGAGSRLYPLTRDRAKPAVPLAGKYRLIDIPMSNCFHADIEKIAILTQFNSVSLHRHIYGTYKRDAFSKGWVQIWAAEQTHAHTDWYQGTADAVRKQMLEIRQANAEHVLILAGDHLYRMDYAKFAAFHGEVEADVTIAVQPVSREAAPALGILKLDEAQNIVSFVEKPKTDAALAGFEFGDDAGKPYMASMGIYIFRMGALEALLNEEGDDFGHDIIPAAMKQMKVAGYVFDGFWEDIGTIRRFYEVNLQMISHDSPFDFYQPERPIYTHPRFLPGSEVHGGHMHNVLLGDGCRIHDATVSNSVIGLRGIVGMGVTMNDTILMGADYYETEQDRAENKRLGQPDMGIGSNSVIERAIVDKNARIGCGVTIRAMPDRPDADCDDWVAREGIVIVSKNGIIRDGTTI